MARHQQRACLSSIKVPQFLGEEAVKEPCADAHIQPRHAHSKKACMQHTLSNHAIKGDAGTTGGICHSSGHITPPRTPVKMEQPSKTRTSSTMVRLNWLTSGSKLVYSQ